MGRVFSVGVVMGCVFVGSVFGGSVFSVVGVGVFGVSWVGGCGVDVGQCVVEGLQCFVVFEFGYGVGVECGEGFLVYGVFGCFVVFELFEYVVGGGGVNCFVFVGDDFWCCYGFVVDQGDFFGVDQYGLVVVFFYVCCELQQLLQVEY